MIQIIQRRFISYIISGLIVVAGISALSMWGLRFGLDYTGGSLMEVSFAESKPDAVEIEKLFQAENLAPVSVQPAIGNSVILKFRTIDEVKHQELLAKFANIKAGAVKETRFESVGPIIGSELKRKSVWAIAIALFFIVSYISWAFRKVSYPVESWKYGIAAILALAHDIILPLGVFSVLGHFYGVEIDSLFVTAILTVLGFSVHDTIVVFDRIRENLFKHVQIDFEATVNKSVNETIMRSINTSLTTLLVLVALYLFGGESIRYFTLTLIIGITVGTYSSIFVASPLLVDWHRFSAKAAVGKKARR